jgi:hypothetical protein
MPTKPSKKLHLINVRVDDDTRDELRRLAAAANRPVSNYVGTLIMDHIAAVRAGREQPKK